MKAEDLFTAIGQIDITYLARCERMPSNKKEPSAMRKIKRSPGRIVRNVLFAAVLVSMLAVTAFAATGYLIYDSPQAMLTALFGDKTGYDHKDVTQVTDPEKPDSPFVSPGFDRIPVEKDVMETQVAPLVSPVGQSIQWKDCTLTIDANLYDPATKCGVLTCRLENSKGIPEYKVYADGQIAFPNGELIGGNQYWKTYLIQDKTSDTVLTAAFYYQLRNPNTTDLELTLNSFSAMAPGETIDSILNTLEQELRQHNTQEQALATLEDYLGKEEYDALAGSLSAEELADRAYRELSFREFNRLYTCPDKIIIPEKAMGKMDTITLADGQIQISPIAISVETSTMENYPARYNNVVKIRFQNGEEYVVRDDNTANAVFAVGENDRDVTYMFNRIIDVKDVTSVILDGGLEFTVE